MAAPTESRTALLRPGMSRLGTYLGSEHAATVGAVALVFFVSFWWVPSFYNSQNLESLLPQVAALGIVTIGQTLVLLVRGFDLSVSAVIPATAVVLTDDGLGSVTVRIFIALGLAVAVGLTNGLLVTKRKVPPFIATFGMLVFLEGARLAYTQAQTSGTIPSWLRWFGGVNEKFAFVPTSLIVVVVVAAVFVVILRSTSFGRWIYAVGSNPNAALYSGVRTDAVTIACYVLCAVLAAVSALVYAGFYGYIDITLGVEVNLNSIAAAVIGGVAFTGGRGTVVGALAGAFVMVAVLNLLALSGLDVEWRFLMQGALLIAAVSLQGIRTRRLTHSA